MSNFGGVYVCIGTLKNTGPLPFFSRGPKVVLIPQLSVSSRLLFSSTGASPPTPHV